MVEKIIKKITHEEGLQVLESLIDKEYLARKSLIGLGLSRPKQYLLQDIIESYKEFPEETKTEVKDRFEGKIILEKKSLIESLFNKTEQYRLISTIWTGPRWQGIAINDVELFDVWYTSKDLKKENDRKKI